MTNTGQHSSERTAEYKGPAGERGGHDNNQLR